MQFFCRGSEVKECSFDQGTTFETQFAWLPSILPSLPTIPSLVFIVLSSDQFCKCTNVLLQEGAAKITDVGMARLMSDAYFTQDASIGTFSWAAPEVLLGEK